MLTFILHDATAKRAFWVPSEVCACECCWTNNREATLALNGRCATEREIDIFRWLIDNLQQSPVPKFAQYKKLFFDEFSIFFYIVGIISNLL